MNKRKILSLAMALSIVAIMAVGATLAYFTDSETETNTITIGNVDIELYEQKYDKEASKWVDYTDDIVMVPTSDETGMTLLNKAVNTKNISSSKEPTYIRTIVAIEDYFAGDEDVKGLHWGYNDTDVTLADGTIRHGVEFETFADLEIDGKEYDVLVFTTKDGKAVEYNNYVLSMTSVWLDKNLTQEQIEKYWEDGKITIEVLSQGIQATDLTHDEAMAQLGEITEANLSDWFDIV